MEHKYSPAAAKRDARIVRTSELYRAGNSMRDISTQLGIGLGTVFRDLREAHEIWRTRAADERQQWIERELATLDWVEVEATRAWVRSIGKTKTIRTETGTSAQGPIQKTSETTGNLAGDPRFLAEIRGCVADRRKLLGLDEPARTQVQAEYTVTAEILEKRIEAARLRVLAAQGTKITGE